MLAFGDDHLVLLKHFATQSAQDELELWGGELLKLITLKNPEIPLQLGLGSLVGSQLSLYHSYQEALFALSNNCYGTDVSLISNFDVMASYLVKNPALEQLPCAAYKAVREKLTDKLDVKYDMRRTIQYLLANNLNISATAKALFIHRNTLGIPAGKTQTADRPMPQPAQLTMPFCAKSSALKHSDKH